MSDPGWDFDDDTYTQVASPDRDLEGVRAALITAGCIIGALATVAIAWWLS